MPQSRERKRAYMRQYMADWREQKRLKEGLTELMVSPIEGAVVSPLTNESRVTYHPTKAQQREKNGRQVIDPRLDIKSIQEHIGWVGTDTRKNSEQIAELRDRVEQLSGLLNQVIAAMSLPKRIQEAAAEYEALRQSK